MNAPNYRTMKDLVNRIQRQLNQLSEGDLAPQELNDLVEDSRELYERLLVLRYKAHEKGLVKAGAVNAEEQRKKEERVIQGFKLNISGSFTPPPVKENKVEEAEVPVNQINLLDAIEEEQNNTGQEDSETIAEPVAEKVEETPEPSLEEQKASLHEQLSSGQEARVSLAEKLQKKPIADLKTAIGLNQKFLFMNDLFAGENNRYNDALERLNSCSDIDEAKNYLMSLGNEFDWDLESESVVSFTMLVERRYS